MMRRLLLVLVLPVCLGAIDAYEFPTRELADRYAVLVAELRCPQCLNTNLAGSDAMIAQDLRREVHRLLLEGLSDDEIRDFMHARYGDFILYRPRLAPGTLILWFGPPLLLVGGLVAVVFIVRGRRERPVLDAGERERLSRLTGDSS